VRKIGLKIESFESFPGEIETCQSSTRLTFFANFISLTTPNDTRIITVPSPSHSLSRKVKSPPDKTDKTMVEAVGLLDDLHNELNTYPMRLKEWFR
jgi:RNA processing factor Prp31